MQAKTAAAYARYSTDHQTSSSIEYQMRKSDSASMYNNPLSESRLKNKAAPCKCDAWGILYVECFL